MHNTWDVHVNERQQQAIASGSTRLGQRNDKHRTASSDGSTEAADGTVRIWHQQEEPTDPTCLVSTVQAAPGGFGSLMVGGMFSLAHRGPLIINKSLSEHRSVSEERCC